MQASDVQIWEALQLPKSAKYVPNNCCICTGVGSGDVALGGGVCGELLPSSRCGQGLVLSHY